MDLRRLTYFITVVEEGSISAAAQRLHMTQPPLSQAVIALERDMGAKLLRRHARGVSPTPAGELLVEKGRNLLRWSERISAEVQRLSSGHAGRLSVASMPTFAWSNLPALLQDYRTAHPGVEVQLADPAPGEVIRMVSEGEADIGFVATSDPQAMAAAFPDLILEPLVTLPLYLVVPQSSINASPGDDSEENPPVRVRDYADFTWFAPEESPGFPGLGETMLHLWRDAGFYPQSVQHVATLQTALPLILAGMGVTVMPLALSGPAATGLLRGQPDISIEPLHATSLRVRNVEPSATLENFLEVVNNHFGGIRETSITP